MRTAKECLQQARHAEQLAAKAIDAHSKAVLLDIARGWRQLVEKDAGLAERTANYEALKNPPVAVDDPRALRTEAAKPQI
jgi:hypothetical protein